MDLPLLLPLLLLLLFDLYLGSVFLNCFRDGFYILALYLAWLASIYFGGENLFLEMREIDANQAKHFIDKLKTLYVYKVFGLVRVCLFQGLQAYLLG